MYFDLEVDDVFPHRPECRVDEVGVCGPFQNLGQVGGIVEVLISETLVVESS